MPPWGSEQPRRAGSCALCQGMEEGTFEQSPVAFWGPLISLGVPWPGLAPFLGTGDPVTAKGLRRTRHRGVRAGEIPMPWGPRV